ncbi:hypothetical protein [Salmonirosea aquatica]|uniref:Uncharacterized protein n=1 Tax=Salmonirosea aquatica TaxID=2654236 RepID=A0A7C9FFF4_9BACT|nr:hypothetical protein [Cytophagaceae bacterium SJW1-29]
MYEKLFAFLSESHDLTLLDSEMEDLLNHILGAVVSAQGRYEASEVESADEPCYHILDKHTGDIVSFRYAHRKHAELEALKRNYEFGSTL